MNKNIFIIVLMLILAINFISGKGHCMGKKEDGILPIDVCTEGKSIDAFLADFRLKNVNKILFKITLDEDTTKTKTLTTITNKKNIKWILHALNKVECLEDYILSYCAYEIWLYENDKIQLKVALSVEDKFTIVRFFKPEQIPSIDSKLGINDFNISDKKFYSWLDALIKKNISAR